MWSIAPLKFYILITGTLKINQLKTMYRTLYDVLLLLLLLETASRKASACTLLIFDNNNNNNINKNNNSDKELPEHEA